MQFRSLSFRTFLCPAGFYPGSLCPAAVLLSVSLAIAQTPPSTPGTQKPTGSQSTPSVPRQQAKSELQSAPNTAAISSGGSIFQQNCAFCHGRDAGGGETGPDLTRSKLVSTDVHGNQIGPVVRNGRVEKGMPRFNLSDREIADLTAFIHEQRRKAESQSGGRKGVDVADLQTGNAREGQTYFEGAGRCSTCHSASGDLAHIAKRYEGLKLEERMLYPQGAKSTVTVTLPSGGTAAGTLAYLDEFTVGLTDSSGKYRSWRVPDVKVKVDAPAEAHVEQLAKYSDADIHNLMAYLQTLK